MMYKILIVDDEASNLRLLERLFRRSYSVISAASGPEALELLGTHDVALIISDQRMPGQTGIDFLKQAAEMRPHTVRIILTGYTDVNDLVEAINSGVIYKYITKPWVNRDLLQTVVRGLEHYEVVKTRHELVQRNARLIEQLDVTRLVLAEVVSKALSAIDATWPNRCRRMADAIASLGSWLELSQQDLGMYSFAAQFCEIDRLSAEGLETSASSWADLLDGLPEMTDVGLAVRFQHERFDGTGIPDKLAGEQIPLVARILSLVSTYDRMLSAAAEADADAVESSLKLLKEDAGKRFDPVLVEAFCVVMSMESMPSEAVVLSVPGPAEIASSPIP